MKVFGNSPASWRRWSWIRWLALGGAGLLGAAGCGSACRLTVGQQGVHWAPRFRQPISIVDPRATYATKSVFYNLQHSAGQSMLFGQQDATWYGLGWKHEPNRSDVKSVCGSYPALYGWDMNTVVDALVTGHARRNPAYQWHRQLVTAAYDRGGLNTFCWHVSNFATGGSFYDTTAAVRGILPGGAQHEAYKRSLNAMARYFRRLRGADGRLIPVVFRPFHEHTGSWFWWGRRHCTTEEFVQLWRFTVTYLRDKKHVHNLLYAYSPDKVPDMAAYFERYPGDAYVDVLGEDDYGDFNTVRSPNPGIVTLENVVAEAQKRGKVAALTEAGLEKITAPDWYTRNLLGQLKSSPQARKIAYVMVWRNAHSGHFYAPYPGHASVPDFLKFYADSLTTFEADRPQLYSVPRR